MDEVFRCLTIWVNFESTVLNEIKQTKENSCCVWGEQKVLFFFKGQCLSLEEVKTLWRWIMVGATNTEHILNPTELYTQVLLQW